jgi:uncharacterized membrane protein YbhN (UPF0104 family)
MLTARARLREFAEGHRGALTVAGTGVMLGLLVVVLAGHWHEFSTAVGSAPIWMLAIAAGLHVASLVSRSESWNLCVRAAGGTVDRHRLYRAASTGYVGNIVNGQFGFATRIAALRRSAPNETPKATALVATEVPILIVEAGLAALTAFTLVGPLGLPWWMPLICLAVAASLACGLRWLARRHQRGFMSGLAVMGDVRGRGRMAGFVVLAIVAQILRNWLMLQASGVNASILDATAVLIAVAVLGALPIGPSVGAGAAVLILGSHGMAAVAAAGVLLTATGAAGALTYGAWAVADRLWAARLRLRLLVLERRRMRSAEATVGSVLRALAVLSPARRRAVELAYFGGFSHTRIPHMLGAWA